MPVQATVILDSGCILPGAEDSPSTDVGYFQSDAAAPDIRVLADGRAYPDATLESLGQGCMIEIRHVRADGSINRSGAKASDSFHSEILHLSELYGKGMRVSPDKFECVLRFDAGLFCGALLKPRKFKLHRQQTGGEFTYSEADAPLEIKRPIAHNIHIHFKLEEGDTIQLARDGKVFWSSSQVKVAERLEIEIIADNTTADKFYRLALPGVTNSCWLPNQGDPPPVCPEFPCKPPGGTIIR